MSGETPLIADPPPTAASVVERRAGSNQAPLNAAFLEQIESIRRLSAARVSVFTVTMLQRYSSS